MSKHRDESNQAGNDGSGCPRIHIVIQERAKLPPMANETKALLKQNNNSGKKLTLFFGRTKNFNPKLLNHILSIWKLKNSLPWSLIEDIDLNKEFYYKNPDTNLYQSKWCATEAKNLYVSLQKAILDKLK